MNCVECKETRQAAAPVPYIVHEGEVSRLERIIKRLWITIILLIALLVGTNCLWAWYENQYIDETTTTYEAVTDGGGTAIANGDGSVNINGQS